MVKIYLSATYADLKPYRDAVYRILRMLRHDVISMEDYVATAAYPLHKCLADVASCDIYVGLVGWRYGYIPAQDNPERKSITELEYRQAGDSGLPRLLFLVDKDAPWPDEFRDSNIGEGEGGQRIAAFRAELEQATLVSYFRTPDDLAKRVSVAVQRRLAEKPVASDHEPRLQAGSVLNTLLPSQFQEVVFRYNVPPQHLPQNVAPNQQAIAVIQYALQKEGEDLKQLLNTISQVAPHLPQR